MDEAVLKEGVSTRVGPLSVRWSLEAHKHAVGGGSSGVHRLEVSGGATATLTFEVHGRAGYYAEAVVGTHLLQLRGRSTAGLAVARTDWSGPTPAVSKATCLQLLSSDGPWKVALKAQGVDVDDGVQMTLGEGACHLTPTEDPTKTAVLGLYSRSVLGVIHKKSKRPNKAPSKR